MADWHAINCPHDPQDLYDNGEFIYCSWCGGEEEMAS